MTSPTDQIRTIRDSRSLTVDKIAEQVSGSSEMLASGRLEEFRACCACVETAPDGSATISRATAQMLGVSAGDTILAMSR